MRVAAHAGPGDQPGVVVATRDGGCHMSLPSWSPADAAESLAGQRISRLVEPSLWQSLPPTSTLEVLGPSVHAYTDEDPGRPAGVHVVGLESPAPLPVAVALEEWREGGFASDVAFCFAIEVDGRVAAAAERANGSTPRVRGALPSAGRAVRGQSVAGFQDGRWASNASMSSACESVMPMSSRPSSSRQRV